MVTLAHSPDGPGSFPVPSSQLPLSVWCLIPEMLPGEGLLKGMGPPWATLSHSFGMHGCSLPSCTWAPFGVPAIVDQMSSPVETYGVQYPGQARGHPVILGIISTLRVCDGGFRCPGRASVLAHGYGASLHRGQRDAHGRASRK